MGASKPPDLRVRRGTTFKVRLTIAVLGIVLVILSALLLLAFDREFPHDQVRYLPAATLFAPPEASR